MPKATQQTTFLFDTTLKTQLKVILTREGKTLTAWVHDQAREYVKRHGAGNPQSTLDKFEDPAYFVCPTVMELDKYPLTSVPPPDLDVMQVKMARALQKIQNLKAKRREAKPW